MVWSLPEAITSPIPRIFQSSFPWGRDGEGVLGLCSGPQTLKSTKAKPAHFNKGALMRGKAVPSQGPPDSICM